VALAVFACACAVVVQSPGWAQTSYMALSKALSSGTPQIDRWHWETHDVAYTDGHYYSVKPPGLVFATLPLYRALDAAGAERVARVARIRGESGGGAPWASRKLPAEQYGFSRRRAIAARTTIVNDAPMAWALGLLGVLAPAVVLLALVARGAERIAAGTGTAVALTLGTGTLVLPFSTLYFSHVLSALLSFAAFWLVWRERSRSGGLRPAMLGLAGLLAGLAVLCEYPLAITAGIVGLYALAARRPGVVRRALAYGGGLAAGVAPLLAYHWWAFGSPLHMSYANAVAKTGFSGHHEIGLNDGGFFGITMPRPEAALELLFSGRGLLTLAPVLVLAIAGVVALWRDRSGGHRAEAVVIAAVALAYFVYNAGYWLPLGGGSPGPRFLFPILPFLALGLAIAWRRWPAPTLALTRDLGGDDGGGDDDPPDDRRQRPWNLGRPHARVRHLPAQRARPRRHRARARRHPAVRDRHRGRARGRRGLDGPRAPRPRCALGASRDRRVGAVRDRAAAPAAAALRRRADADRRRQPDRAARGSACGAAAAAQFARALSAGRRAPRRRAACARGPGRAAVELTPRAAGCRAPCV